MCIGISWSGFHIQKVSVFENPVFFNPFSIVAAHVFTGRPPKTPPTRTTTFLQEVSMNIAPTGQGMGGMMPSPY